MASLTTGVHKTGGACCGGNRQQTSCSHSTDVQALSRGTKEITTPAFLLSLSVTPKWKRFKSHISYLGLVCLDLMRKGLARCSPLCPAPRPGFRRGPRKPASGLGRPGFIYVFHHKGSFGLRFDWLLPQDLFAVGDPVRAIKPQTTELPGPLGHANLSIRWSPRRVFLVFN